MAATVATFANNLQRYYLKGANRQINDESIIFSELEKKKVANWTGENAHYHAWTQRNNGVGHAPSTAIPVAGEQNSVQPSVPTSRLYGVFEIDGETMESAPPGGGAVFIDWASFEMKGLVLDIKNEANQTFVAGHFVKGYLNQHQASTLTADIQTLATMLTDASAAQVWEYTGEHRFFATAVPGTVATWILVNLIRCDTFNPVDEVGAPTDLNIWVVDSDPVAGTLTIRVSADAATDGFTTATVAAGNAIAVVLANVQATDQPASAAIGAAPVTGAGSPTEQNRGIFSLLSDPSLFNVPRNSADAAAVPAVAAAAARGGEVLQCNVQTQATTGTHARTDPTIPRLQRMLGIIDVEAGTEPSNIFIHPFFKSVYVALGIGTINVDGSTAGNLDVGFRSTGYSFGGIKMRSSRHVPNGMMIFFDKSTFLVLEKGAGKFADADGNMLKYLSNDLYRGYWRKYYNLACTRPNANMILVGLSLN